MTIGTGPAGSGTLPPEYQHALGDAVSELTDQWLDALTLTFFEEQEDPAVAQLFDDADNDEELDDEAEPWGTPIDHPVLESLPPAYADRYASAFVRRFAACVVTVGWKLAQPEPYELACVAEALALRSGVRVLREHFGGQEGELALAAFARAALGHVDFESLYSRTVTADAVEPTVAFEGWFEPFSDRAPVHPYVVATMADDEDDADNLYGPDDLYDPPLLGAPPLGALARDPGAGIAALAELLAGPAPDMSRSAETDLIDRRHVARLAYLDASHADTLETDKKVRGSERELMRLLRAKLRRLGVVDPDAGAPEARPLPIPPYLLDLLADDEGG